jgi:hypothetical protein
MTFSKIETSYVAYCQKRAAYDHKCSGWHLLERQVQDKWWVLPATSTSYCSFLRDLYVWHMVMPTYRFIFPFMFSTRFIRVCFLLCTGYSKVDFFAPQIIVFELLQSWGNWLPHSHPYNDDASNEIYSWTCDFEEDICWLVQRDDKFTAQDFYPLTSVIMYMAPNLACVWR